MKTLRESIASMEEGIARVGELMPGLPVPEAQLARLLLVTAGVLDEILADKIKQHGINHSEFLPLVMLYHQPEGRTPRELCTFSAQGTTNMTRITNVLAKHGLIRRHPDPDDRRRVIILLTAAGRRLVERTLPSVWTSMDALFTGVNEKEKRELRRLLGKLAHNLDRALISG